MIVSIDIGTSYSSLSMLGKDGKPIPVAIGEDGTAWGSKFSLPSAVFVEDSGNIFVGQAAMRSRLRKPDCFRMEFKRNLGEDTPLLLGGRSFRVEELYTELLLHMKACVKKTTGEDIELAYITCPATYRKDKKERLISAAKAAGLFQMELVPEPTAAAMSYVADGYVKDGQTLLVYDFGGGTFDAALIQYKDGAFLPLGEPLGLPRCGGIDMDRLIYQDMMKAVDPDTIAMLQKKQEHYLRFAGQLSEKAVQIKHQLSSAQNATEYIPMGWDQLEYTLTRQAFEQMIAPMIDQTIHVCEDALTSAGLDKSGLSAVVLVGGTSRVPLVQQMVQQFAGKVPVYAAPDVDLAVVQGALSYRLYNSEKKSASKESNATILAPVQTGEKWGYIDQTGKLVISCQWDDARIFHDGLAQVKKNEKWGFIDKFGKLVSPYQWDDADVFSDGLVRVQKNQKYGFIDKSGKLVSPCQWDYASWAFDDGLLLVTKNSKYGFIDKSGKLVIPCQWDNASTFSDGLARVQKDYKYGYIDKSGKLVIPCQWDFATSFRDGLAGVRKDKQWGVIDKSGKLVSPCQWDDADAFSDGLVRVEKDGKWGLIDTTGKLVIPCQWDGISWAFLDGLVSVRKDQKYGFIDKSGKLVIPCQWDYASDFNDGLAMVEKDNQQGVIDKSGKLVILCQCDHVYDFNDGLARVKKDGKYGFTDKSGKLVIPCQWDYADDFDEGLAMVRKDGKYGFIDKTGRQVIPCQWDDASAFRKAD